MRRRLFTLMSLVCSLAVAATVYKWVDEHGVVHYSDQPHPNAQKVDVQAAQTYKAGDMPATPGGPPAPPASARPPPYQGCAIAHPADDQTLTNVDSLTVIVRTDPALRPGDQIFLMLRAAAQWRRGDREPVHPRIGGSRHAHPAGAGTRQRGRDHVPDPGRDVPRAPALGAQPGQPPPSLNRAPAVTAARSAARERHGR